jgi:outer membrane protein, heavy metal efflux system
MNSKLILLIIIFMVTIVNVPAQEKDIILEELIVEAISISPKLQLLNAKLGLASSRIEQGTNLPDPILTFGLMNMPTNSFAFTQEPMTSKIIGFSQAIPYPAGLSAAADVKSVDTLIVRQEIINVKNEIRKNISNSYYDLQFVREEQKLNNERIKLLNQILEVVKSKYEVGSASMQNIINVEVELTRVTDKIEMLNGKKNALVAEINAFLLKDATQPVVSENLFSIEYGEVDFESLINTAIKNQPNLKGIQLSEHKASLMEEQAEYEFYPNFNLGVQYSQRENNILTGMDYKDFLSVVAGITLPINYGGKKTAKVNEAKYLQNLYQKEYQSTMQDLSRSIGIISAKISELAVRNKLNSTRLLPLAEQSLTVALSDFQVGKIDFINVINAEKEILSVKTDLIKIQTDYNKNIVMLEYLVGSDLPQNMKVNGDLK